MPEDLPEKGAIVQRDKETYAVPPHIPGGLSPISTCCAGWPTWRKIRRQGHQAHLGPSFCPGGTEARKPGSGVAGSGTRARGRHRPVCALHQDLPRHHLCRIGMQDAVGVGLQLDDKYHGMPLPCKFKIGVSGCPNNCSESVIKDLGLVGAAKGWRVMAGGFASGLKPRLADLIATDLTDAEAISLAERVLDWYKEANKKNRLGRIIGDIGLATFKAGLGLPAE